MGTRISHEFAWFPEEILRVKRSFTSLAKSANMFLKQSMLEEQLHSTMPIWDERYDQNTAPLVGEESPLGTFIIKDILGEGLGLNPTDKRLADGILVQLLMNNAGNETAFIDTLSKFVSKNAGISWSTKGHSGTDVSLYAYGYASSLLKGFHANNEIGLFLANLFNLDLDRVTKMLRQR